MKNTSKTLELRELEQISGGGIFSAYKDKQYEAAGVTVVGSGWFYNDGYKYNGKDITTDEATWLTYYYIWNHNRALSIEEAKRYYVDTSRGMDYSDI